VLAGDWEMQPAQLPTRWTSSVSPTNALPEYPRPQLVRSNWQNLNGLWDYAITPQTATMPGRFQGKILVPYPVESALSGVKKALKTNEFLWYRRTIALKPRTGGQRTLLHFGAVDYQATVYVNGAEAGSHTGGYQNFTLDITDAIRRGSNELVVRVADPTRSDSIAQGKQVAYTSTSGIWQTVWMEKVPRTYIESLSMAPDVDRGELRLQVNLNGETRGYTAEAIVRNGTNIVATRTVSGPSTLSIPQPQLWSPDNPFLYDLQIRVLDGGGKIIDDVQSYFGLRKIEVKEGTSGDKQVLLNGKYLYTLGVLDQGFWPDGIYTAPTDEALKFDIQAVKAMGFNTIRKHVKLEPSRWYYHCDKLGVLVWQDMPSGVNATQEARAQFEREIEANLAQLHNHPSIVTWVLFNERWGAYDQERLAQWIRQLDPSRLLDAHSGPNGNISQWLRHVDARTLSRFMGGDFKPVTEVLKNGIYDRLSEWAGSDFADTHQYPYPEIPRTSGKVRIAGEYGGIGAYIHGHIWDRLNPGFSYLPVPLEQTAETYAESMVRRLQEQEQLGLMGAFYTQLTDVEQEQNGLMTYDRAVGRVPLAELVEINRRLVPQPRNHAAVIGDFRLPDADRIPESRRYAEMREQYRQRKGDQEFLKSLAMLALRQKDQAIATSVANELIERSQTPYSVDIWKFILAVTHTSKDRGFDILRTQMAHANAVLGQNAAENKIRDVISREEIAPLLSGEVAAEERTLDWPAIIETTRTKYGALGAEAAFGAAMMHYMMLPDWMSFGKYYALYFETAAGRSEYSVENTSYAVFSHVADPKVLDVAVSTAKLQLDKGWYDMSIRMDTYAGLLYKTGRRKEAIEWQEKAVWLSNGRDGELSHNLEKMTAGRPTW
jgi:hypothetical protein